MRIPTSETIKRINLQQEWNFLIKEFNSLKFRKYTYKQRERWFNLQLILSLIVNTDSVQSRTALEQLYLKYRKSNS